MIQTRWQHCSHPCRRQGLVPREGEMAGILTWVHPGVLGGSAAGLGRSFWAHQAGLSGGEFVPQSPFCWLEGERHQEDHCSKPTACSQSGAEPAPHWAEERQGKTEHPRGLCCGKRHCRGTFTCRPVPQRQPHHVAAQPVGEAVDPLVVEPVTRRLLQLTAGEGGHEGQRGAALCTHCHSPGERGHHGHVQQVAGQR